MICDFDLHVSPFLMILI